MLNATPYRPLEVSSEAPETDPRLADLIEQIRDQADRFVFLIGGAAGLESVHYRSAVLMLDALAAIALDGYRLAVGDGGTRTGIMKAAGIARLRSGNRFLLLGVAPAIVVWPRGSTALDPNHSHIVTVTAPAATRSKGWGTETRTMYWLFSRLAEGRPSVAVIINGGRVALKEVAANVAATRPIIVAEGTGRAADAIASLVRGSTPEDREFAELAAHLEAIGGLARPELFRLLPLDAGAEGLRRALLEVIGPAGG